MSVIYKIIFTALGIALAMTIHEYVRALLAVRLGDSSARDRLTFNPFKQIEPLGFICMFFSGYGWSNPVPVNQSRCIDRLNVTVVLNTVPSLVNVIMGMALAMGARAAAISADFFPVHAVFLIRYIVPALYLLARANLALALSNLIPVEPLDGSGLLYQALCADGKIKFKLYQKYLQLFLLLLLLSGAVGLLLNPLLDSLLKFVGYKPL